LLRELLPVLVAGLVPIAVLALIVTGTALNLVAWQPPVQQTSQFGTANSQNGITAIVSDSTGIYATGFVGYIGFPNATSAYLFVSRYNLNGQEVWSQHFGDPYLSSISGVGVGTDGVYIVGELWVSPVNQSSFVIKYDLNGNQVWNRKFENASIGSRTISVTTTGVYVGGVNGTRYFVEDYDSNGSLVWTDLFGNNTGSISIFASLNGIYVASFDTPGSATGNSLVEKYGLNGILEWTQACSCVTANSGSTISADSTGIYAVGTVQSRGGTFDGLLAKYDFIGNRLWTTSFNAPGFNSVQQVEVSADSSGIYLATTTTDLRGIVMKYDGNSNRVWSVQLPWTTGTGLLTRGDAIALGDAGVYVGGDSRTSTPYNVGFVAQISKSSSLVFFGTNPPYSFGLVGLLAAVVATSILWLKRRQKKRFRAPAARASYHSQKVPTDMYSRT
jgi:hypothetical protein